LQADMANGFIRGNFTIFINMNCMKKIAAYFFSLIFSMTAIAQGGFHFEPESRKKVVIPFQLINNLVIVPVYVNGIKLNFLLDTGVDETILFSLDDQDEVKLNNVEKILLRGLGGNEAVEGLKSSHNKINFSGYSDSDHDIYIVLDQNFNFSASIGIPVNGIIGYQFFRNHLVEINYDKKKIAVYKDTPKTRQKLSSQFSEEDITIENGKPYILSKITTDENPVVAKLLIDSGNTDAVWLFRDRSDSLKIPVNAFDDFLGRGLSGDILGKRGRIAKFWLDGFVFINPLVAFPDFGTTSSLSMVENRLGSVGGEILKRFSVIFDYSNKKIYLKKGSHYNQPFNYNMSGIEVQHEGMSWVQERVVLEPVSKITVYESGARPESFTYKFKLKPVFAISNIRKDSPAELSGLKKGDILVSINGTECSRISLQEINYILKSEEGKNIEIEVERNKVVLKFKFRLKSII
jgi:hypothetical protein